MGFSTLTGRRYARPARGWPGLITRSGALGPLPAGQEWIDASPAEFATARSYRWLAVALFALVITGVVGLSLLIPGAGASPVTVVSEGLFGDAVTAGVLVVAVDAFLAVIVVACVRQRRTPYRMLCQAAMAEELWFRAGAESWRPRTRVTSCLAFGIAHLANLIVAFITLGMLAVVGGVLMAVYLRELRLGADRRAALVVAAKLHAAYNVLAFGLLAGVAVLASAAAVWALVGG